MSLMKGSRRSASFTSSASSTTSATLELGYTQSSSMKHRGPDAEGWEACLPSEAGYSCRRRCASEKPHLGALGLVFPLSIGPGADGVYGKEREWCAIWWCGEGSGESAVSAYFTTLPLTYYFCLCEGSWRLGRLGLARDRRTSSSRP